MPALVGRAPPATPASTGTGVVTPSLGVVPGADQSHLSKLTHDRLHGVHRTLFGVAGAKRGLSV